MGRERSKCSLQTISVYIDNSKEFIAKLLVILTEFSNVAGQKVSIEKLLVLLLISSDQLENVKLRYIVNHPGRERILRGEEDGDMLHVYI